MEGRVRRCYFGWFRATAVVASRFGVEFRFAPQYVAFCRFTRAYTCWRGCGFYGFFAWLGGFSVATPFCHSAFYRFTVPAAFVIFYGWWSGSLALVARVPFVSFAGGTPRLATPFAACGCRWGWGRGGMVAARSYSAKALAGSGLG